MFLVLQPRVSRAGMSQGTTYHLVVEEIMDKLQDLIDQAVETDTKRRAQSGHNYTQVRNVSLNAYLGLSISTEEYQKQVAAGRLLALSDNKQLAGLNSEQAQAYMDVLTSLGVSKEEATAKIVIAKLQQ